MSRILVTGAAGFIGSHLVDRLLYEGHEVTGLDCFTDYYSRLAKQQNLSRALSHERFRFVEGDLLRLDLDGLLGGVDKVAHLAGEPGLQRPRLVIYSEQLGSGRHSKAEDLHRVSFRLHHEAELLGQGTVRVAEGIAVGARRDGNVGRERLAESLAAVVQHLRGLR